MILNGHQKQENYRQEDLIVMLEVTNLYYVIYALFNNCFDESTSKFQYTIQAFYYTKNIIYRICELWTPYKYENT